MAQRVHRVARVNAERVSLDVGSDRWLGAVGAVWGIAGVVLLLGQAIWRLTPIALTGVRDPSVGPLHWVLLAGWVGFMLYSEGFKGFQRGFSPRVVARAAHLAQNPRPLHVLLAPAFCMGLFHASRKRLITSWSLVLLMVGLVLLVHRVPQPWRGLIDVGVVAGLLWGLIALTVFAVQALAGRSPRVAPDLPTA